MVLEHLDERSFRKFFIESWNSMNFVCFLFFLKIINSSINWNIISMNILESRTKKHGNHWYVMKNLRGC